MFDDPFSSDSPSNDTTGLSAVAPVINTNEFDRRLETLRQTVKDAHLDCKTLKESGKCFPSRSPLCKEYKEMFKFFTNQSGSLTAENDRRLIDGQIKSALQASSDLYEHNKLMMYIKHLDALESINNDKSTKGRKLEFLKIKTVWDLNMWRRENLELDELHKFICKLLRSRNKKY